MSLWEALCANCDWRHFTRESGDPCGALRECWAGNTVVETYEMQESIFKQCDVKLKCVCV